MWLIAQSHCQRNEGNSRRIVPPDRSRIAVLAGRKSITESNPRLLEALEALIDSQTRGDPESPCDGFVRTRGPIAAQLARKETSGQSHEGGADTNDLTSSLPKLSGRRKRGADHPDRDKQFRHIQCSGKEVSGSKVFL